ncbi:MAG: hypothetical protein HQL16_01165 [Candidatus Omnitrophica bacterium]|nr:hypothetical protein [Candidatus Omnitrophota bacterium]
MKEKLVPEEKLLQLIKSGEKPKPVAADTPANPDSSIRVVRKEKNFKAVMSAMVFSCLSLTFLRKLVVLALLISAVYLGEALIYPLIGLRKPKSVELSVPKESKDKARALSEVRTLESYLSGVEKRNIFSSLGSDEVTETKTTVAGLDSVKDLALVAILSGQNPQAALQDKKTEKIYYVIKGQMIGDVQVEDIEEGKVLLNDKGTRYELYL